MVLFVPTAKWYKIFIIKNRLIFGKTVFKNFRIVFYFFVSTLPNGLFFAKSTKIGAATKIEE